MSSKKIKYVAASNKPMTNNKVVYQKKPDIPLQNLSQHQKQMIRKDPYIYLIEKLHEPKKIVWPFYIKFFFVIIMIFFFFCIIQTIIVFLRYKVMIQWWNKNGGKQYKRVFSIQLLALFNGFKLGEKFYSLFLSEQASIPSTGIGVFMTNLYYSYAKINNEDQQGFLLPYNFCVSIAIGKSSQYDKPSIDTSLSGNDQSSYDPSDVQWTLNDNYWPTNTPAWQLLLRSWGAYGSESDMGKDINERDKAWQVSNNFIWTNYLINYDSPFILSFMFNTYTDPNQAVEWTSNAFTIAVGINKETQSEYGYNGGWWGYATEGLSSQTDLTLGLIYQNLYSSVHYSPPNSNSCGGSDWGGAAASGAATGLTTFAFLGGSKAAAALGLASKAAAPETGGMSIGAAALIGLIAGALTTASSAASSGCF
jgi:hypothetical protein